MPTKIGFIGTGGIARCHVETLSDMPDATMTAFCDLELSRARDLADQHDAKAYTDYNQMLDAEKLDAVFICTPSTVRAEPIGAAASRGVAVFVEKPPAFNLDAARATLRSLREHPVVNSVGFMYRWASITDQVGQRINGRPILGARSLMACDAALNPEQSRWLRQLDKSGGPAIDQAVHLVDVARYLIGDVQSVYNIATNAIREKTKDFTSPDALAISLLYDNNAIHTHLHSWSHRGWLADLELIGEDFRFVLDYVTDTFTGTDKGEQFRGGDGKGEVPFYRREVEQFLAAVRTKNRGLVRSSYADAARSLATVISANSSMLSGEPVKIPAL